MNKEFEIIAETAFSHEGNFDYLIEQVTAAKHGKVDYVKFQIFIDKGAFYVQNHPSYNKAGKWIIKEENWIRILDYAKSLKLKVIVLPVNLPSFEFCIKNERLIDIYEIHPVCLNEYFLLKELSNTDKGIILGIGGRLPEEIDYALNILDMNKNQISMMYGFQSFPTDITKINLNKIKTLSNLFNCKIGYADHTRFNDKFFYNLIEYAYLFSARVFEKHIVVEKGKKRVDYETAISSKDFVEMRIRLNKLSNIIGDGNIFRLNDKETEYRKREKQIVAAKNIDKNKIIKLEDLTYKITEDRSDFEQNEITKIINRKSTQYILKDSTIKFKYVE